jgi:hypothetical protein
VKSGYASARRSDDYATVANLEDGSHIKYHVIEVIQRNSVVQLCTNIFPYYNVDVFNKFLSDHFLTLCHIIQLFKFV